MKRYFIEVVSTATETNKNFHGTVMRYVYGKGEELVARQPIEDPVGYAKYEREFNNTDYKRDAEEYGYKTRKIAERVAKEHYNEVDTYGFWTNEVRVIEVEV